MVKKPKLIKATWLWYESELQIVEYHCFYKSLLNNYLCPTLNPLFVGKF